jgi:hypothetical protein
MSAIKIIGKLNPKQYSEMLDHLTRKKIKNPFIKAKDIVVDKKLEVEQREMFNRFNQANPRTEKAGGGMLVQPSADGRRPEYGTATSGFASLKKKGELKEFIDERDKDKDIPKVRRYLRKVLKRKDSINFKDIKDIKNKAGIPDSKVDADISRLINTEEFKDRITTDAKKLQKGQGESFRNILRDIKKTIPKGKKQFINVSYTAKKNKLPGKPDSGAYYRILNEPEFKDTFVVLSGDVKSNPQIIRFAEEFERLYEISDIDEDFFRQLAINIYGDDKPRTIRAVGADASKYAEFLYGVRDVTDADGKKLKLPSIEKRGDYLFELLDDVLGLQEGEKGKVKPITYDQGIVRDRMLAVRDGLLGLKEGQTERQRVNIRKLLKKGYNLDEVAGIAATHEIAPGYTELVQGLKKKVNADKMVKIDKPFARIFEQVITGQKPSKGFQYGFDKSGKRKFYQNIEEVVNLYNKDAAAYGKKFGIDVPLIEYSPGKKINPKNFLPNYKYLSPEAKANIQDLARKGIGVRTDAFTMGQLENLDLTKNKKSQAEILRKMGFKCKYAKADGGRIGLSTGSGRCDDPASYTDDINKTRQDLKSDDVRVRANAQAKLTRGLDIAKTLPTVGKFLRRVGQATVGGVSKTLQFLGVTSPIGIALEGIVEGGIYDFFKARGYTDQQALSETFFPGIISGRPEGVPWYGGAESLLEKELTEGQPKVAQYVDALKDQEQVFDAFARKDIGQRAQRKDIVDAASADIQDLNRSGTISRINRIMNPESMASRAYQTAVETQQARQEQRARDYKDRFYVQREPSDFQQKKLQRERNEAMLQMFPPTTVEQVQSAYKAAGRGDELKDFEAEDYQNIMRDADIFNKQKYFAENFRFEKAGGGIAKIAGVDQGPPPERGPNSQGLQGLMKRVRNL